MNVTGLCLFGYLSTHVTLTTEFLSAVTGRLFTPEDMLLTGERIANLHQAYNIREGINPPSQPAPGRAFGHPPLTDGPTSGMSLQIETMVQEYLDEMDWTQDAAVPKISTIKRLGLGDVVQYLWK